MSKRRSDQVNLVGCSLPHKAVPIPMGAMTALIAGLLSLWESEGDQACTAAMDATEGGLQVPVASMIAMLPTQTSQRSRKSRDSEDQHSEHSPGKSNAHRLKGVLLLVDGAHARKLRLAEGGVLGSLLGLGAQRAQSHNRPWGGRRGVECGWSSSPCAGHIHHVGCGVGVGGLSWQSAASG